MGCAPGFVPNPGHPALIPDVSAALPLRAPLARAVVACVEWRSCCALSTYHAVLAVKGCACLARWRPGGRLWLRLRPLTACAAAWVAGSGQSRPIPNRSRSCRSCLPCRSTLPRIPPCSFAMSRAATVRPSRLRCCRPRCGCWRANCAAPRCCRHRSQRPSSSRAPQPSRQCATPSRLVAPPPE